MAVNPMAARSKIRPVPGGPLGKVETGQDRAIPFVGALDKYREFILATAEANVNP